MAKPFSKMLDDDCPWCKNQRSKEVKLRAESKKATMHIVCSAGCGFDMTEPDYDSAKLAGRL